MSIIISYILIILLLTAIIITFLEQIRFLTPRYNRRIFFIIILPLEAFFFLLGVLDHKQMMGLEPYTQFRLILYDYGEAGILFFVIPIHLFLFAILFLLNGIQKTWTRWISIFFIIFPLILLMLIKVFVIQ